MDRCRDGSLAGSRFLLWGAACLSLALGNLPLAAGGDWPQILGPHRTGIAADDERLADWGAAGPSVVWQKDVGSGHSGLAVAGGIAVLHHRLGDEEVVEGLGSRTGDQLWRDAYPTTFQPQVGEIDGPLAVPAIAGDRVVTFGAQGVLSCYSLAAGEFQWRRNTHDDFDAREGYFGAGCSPLIVGDRVIVTVGGFRSEAAVVAFSLATGETLWHVHNDHASYSSPVVVKVGDESLVAVLTRMSLLLIEPQTGAVRAETRYGQGGPTVTAANPLQLPGGDLFLTASYGTGAAQVHPTANSLEILWQRDDLFSSQYGTPVADEDLLIGIDGRQDIPPADLKCFDPIARRELWTKPGFGYGTLVRAGDRLLILRTDGRLTLANVNREQFDPLAEATVLNGTARALPALADGMLYVRDESVLKCLQVGQVLQPVRDNN
jgi:outer membrane protein assembly factor BamB